MKSIIKLSAALVFVAGCATTPEPPAELVQARQQVPTATNQALANQVASEEVERAREELATANQLLEERAAVEHVVHHAYMANSYADLINANIANHRNEELIAAADERRNEVLIRAREFETATARQSEREAEYEAEVAQGQATRARIDAIRAREVADMRAREARELANELEDIRSEQDEARTVFTLDSVLFDTNQSSLKAGALPALTRIADFLRDHENEPVRIYGHTDNSGNAGSNLDLSQRRADAVRTALLDMGLSSNRITAEGRGQDYPVASNDTEVGRQENRRVEIVVGGSGSSVADFDPR